MTVYVITRTFEVLTSFEDDLLVSEIVGGTLSKEAAEDWCDRAVEQEIYCMGALIHAENRGLLRFMGLMHGYNKTADDIDKDWQKTFDDMQKEFASMRHGS